MPNKKIIFSILILIILLWIGFQASLRFPETEICQISKNTGYKDCPTHYVLTVPFFWISYFVEAHDGAIVALFTVVLTFSTIGLWRETRRLADGAKEQAEDMKSSIAEAARAATAMEKLAVNSEASLIAGRKLASQQMRAYVTVVTGSANYQEKAKNIFFAAMPHFVNTGHTPAHNVRFKHKAEILNINLPSDFAFPLPIEIIGGSIIGASQNTEVTIAIKHFVPDDEIAGIKAGHTQALFIWGIVYYDDVFGEPHETRFCQTYIWFGEGNETIVRGYYNSRHNEAT